eukprot:1161599-Pelagomonas_calceolata.AAC.2
MSRQERPDRPSPQQQPFPCNSLSAAFPFKAAATKEGRAQGRYKARGNRGAVVEASCAVGRGAAGSRFSNNVK